MKFAKLIRRNLFRNKLRAILTILLLAVIFFFVATLLAILDNFENFSNAGEGANRLVVQSAISLANLLPYAHEQKIRADSRRRRHRQAAVDRRVLQGEVELLRQLRRRRRQVPDGLRRLQSRSRRSWPRFRPTAAARWSART